LVVACVLFGIFFFQAEDGIRDGHVTGVQTCALPISIDVGSGDVSGARLQARPVVDWRGRTRPRRGRGARRGRVRAVFRVLRRVRRRQRCPLTGATRRRLAWSNTAPPRARGAAGPCETRVSGTASGPAPSAVPAYRRDPSSICAVEHGPAAPRARGEALFSQRQGFTMSTPTSTTLAPPRFSAQCSTSRDSVMMPPGPSVLL